MHAVLLDNTAQITQLVCQLAMLFLVVPQANVIVYKKHDTACLLTSCVIFEITQLACKRDVFFCQKLTQTQTQSQTQVVSSSFRKK